jgi:hypothetical protein
MSGYAMATADLYVMSLYMSEEHQMPNTIPEVSSVRKSTQETDGSLLSLITELLCPTPKIGLAKTLTLESRPIILIFR